MSVSLKSRTANRLTKAFQIARTDGLGALVLRTWRALTRPLITYWLTDHLWEGKIIEWLGNRARIEGAVFDLNSPHIATRNKGALWKRIYERPERTLCRRYMPIDTPIIELGASIGVVACVTNRRLTNPDQHLVVEANPDLIPVLERNKELNGCKFKIVNAAVAYGSAQVTFYVDDKFIAGSLGRLTQRPVIVPTCQLASLAESVNFDRFNLICDIEGAEVALVEHEIDYLSNHVSWFVVETHRKIVGAEPLIAMDRTLLDRGFAPVETRSHVVCYRNTLLQ